MTEMQAWRPDPEPEPKWSWPMTFAVGGGLVFLSWLGLWKLWTLVRDFVL